MSTLDNEFKKALNDVTELEARPENKHMLSLYANFKQATKGDCSGKRPGILDIAGRAKYDAWKKNAGTESDAAKRTYIDLVNKLQQG